MAALDQHATMFSNNHSSNDNKSRRLNRVEQENEEGNGQDGEGATTPTLLTKLEPSVWEVLPQNVKQDIIQHNRKARRANKKPDARKSGEHNSNQRRNNRVTIEEAVTEGTEHKESEQVDEMVRMSRERAEAQWKSLCSGGTGKQQVPNAQWTGLNQDDIVRPMAGARRPVGFRDDI